MRVFAAAAFMGALLPVAGMADTPPSAGAMKLWAALAAPETGVGDTCAYVDKPDRDDDGFWKIGHHATGGRKVDVTIDPVTGQPRT